MAEKFTHLEVKDWRKHQHYGKRRPPWIKLYTRLLDDAGFMSLPEPAQAQLVKLWILAATMEHPLRHDARFLAGKIGSPKRFYLAEIIAAGFMIPCYQDASNLIAQDAQNATPVSTENREQRTETTSTVIAPAKPWQPIRENSLAERLVSDVGRTALAALLQRFGDKAGIVGEAEACMDGLRGSQHRATGEQMDMALSDYAAKVATGTVDRWEPRLFRGCIRSSMAPVRQRLEVRRGGVGQRTFDNATEALKDIPEAS